jgi:hypothetical protein
MMNGALLFKAIQISFLKNTTYFLSSNKVLEKSFIKIYFLFFLTFLSTQKTPYPAFFAE